MSADDLTTVGQRLARLEEHPLRTHPAVLDEVHRALVGELERLAGAVSGDTGQQRSGRAPDHR